MNYFKLSQVMICEDDGCFNTTMMRMDRGETALQLLGKKNTAMFSLLRQGDE